MRGGILRQEVVGKGAGRGRIEGGEQGQGLDTMLCHILTPFEEQMGMAYHHSSLLGLSRPKEAVVALHWGRREATPSQGNAAAISEIALERHASLPNPVQVRIAPPKTLPSKI